MLLWRCLASTLAWTFWSWRLNLFSSVTLFCWGDIGGSAAGVFVFSCRTFRARSMPLSRGFSGVSVPGACSAAVVWLRLTNDAVPGHRWQFVRDLTRKRTVVSPALQSLMLHDSLLHVFIVASSCVIYICLEVGKTPDEACSPVNYIRGTAFRIKAHMRHFQHFNISIVILIKYTFAFT